MIYGCLEVLPAESEGEEEAKIERKHLSQRWLREVCRE